jgi:hypothetical protein
MHDIETSVTKAAQLLAHPDDIRFSILGKRFIPLKYWSTHVVPKTKDFPTRWERHDTAFPKRIHSGVLFGIVLLDTLNFLDGIPT